MTFPTELERAYVNALNNWDIKRTVTQRELFYAGANWAAFESELVKGLVECIPCEYPRATTNVNGRCKRTDICRYCEVIAAYELARKESGG